MQDYLGLAAIAIIGTLLAMSVKKHSPDMALLLALATGIVLLAAAMRYLQVVLAFWADLTRGMGVADQVAGPLLKAVGISVITHISAQICRDGGEGALGAKLELAGTAACIIVMLPLLSSVLSLIASLI